MLRENQTALTHTKAAHVSVLWEVWKEGKVSNILTLFCLFYRIFSLELLCISARNYDPGDSNSLFLPLVSSPRLPPDTSPPQLAFVPFETKKKKKEKTSWTVFMLFFLNFSD